MDDLGSAYVGRSQPARVHKREGKFHVKPGGIAPSHKPNPWEAEAEGWTQALGKSETMPQKRKNVGRRGSSAVKSHLLPALLEDPSSVPVPTSVVHNSLYLQLQGIQYTILASVGTLNIVKKTYLHTNRINLKLGRKGKENSVQVVTKRTCTRTAGASG